ncbi:MAG: hypothetical protein RR890_03245 [Longicatena sp.]
MKKVLTCIMCCFMCIALTSCKNSEKSAPKETTKLFLDAYKAKDEKKIKEYSEWEEYNVKALSIQDSDYIEGVDKELQKQVYEMMMDFDHHEVSEKIDGDNASVKVELTIYNFEEATKKGIDAATLKAEELSKSVEITDAQLEAEISKIMFTHMKESKKNKKQEVTVNLKKVDNTWKVSNNNADIQNILSSNMQNITPKK